MSAAVTAAAKATPWGDALAGLSIAGLLLPEAVAYSGIAKLPPQAGVIALFAGLASYGLIGRSRFAIVSATSSSAAVLAAATLALSNGDLAQRLLLATVLVALTGVCFLLAAVARLGVLSNVIAKPVLRGYAFGLAMVIAVGQLPGLLGMSVHQQQFVPLLLELGQRVADWQKLSLGVGVGGLLGLFVLERIRSLPGPLLVIVAGIAMAGWLSARGVALTGPITLALEPPSLQLPAGGHWVQLGALAAALMLILYAESYGSIRTYALKHGDEVAVNRDLVALGVANLIAGLFHGMPVGAGYSATSANEAAGASSRLAGLCALGVVLALVLLFLPWIERIPRPVLAAIVIHAVSKSMRPAVFRPYLQWRRDRLVALAAVLAVIAFGVLNGLLVAIAFSLLMLLRTLATPRLTVLGRMDGGHDFVDIRRHPEAQRLPGRLILRPEAPLFFANAEPMLAQARVEIARNTDVTMVILSLEESPDLDGTTLEALGDFARWLSTCNKVLRLTRLKDAARDVLQRAALPQLPSSALNYWSVEDAALGAIDAATERV